MEIVTKYFNEFREVSRHLRNTCYVSSKDDKWDRLDDFFDISVMLFQHLVCAPINIDYDKYEWLCEPAPIFKLKGTGARLPIMINRLSNVDHGDWDHSISVVDPDDLELTFISYFDWDENSMIDHKYIMCKITDASKSTSVVGHTALIESSYVSVYYDRSAKE